MWCDQVTLIVLLIIQSIWYVHGYVPIIKQSLWKPAIQPRFISSSRLNLLNKHLNEIESLELMLNDNDSNNIKALSDSIFIAPAIAIGSFIMMTSPVHADVDTNTAPFLDPVVASAIVAYGHYLAIIVMVSCVLTERLLIKADMTVKDEWRVVIADSIYGVAGVLMLVTGETS